MANQEEIEKLLNKVAQVKKGVIDLSSDEDLSIAVMNLVAIEEHFFFTGAKTAKPEYFDLLGQVREIRKELMKKLVKETEGESWCLQKHFLASTMRLIEVGTKYQNENKKEEAQDLFKKAFELYSLFWALNLKVIDAGQVKKINDDQLNVEDKGKTDFLGKLGDIVKKLIDCCKE
jgi:hypothetical protein